MKRVIFLLVVVTMVLVLSVSADASLNEGLVAYWSFDNCNVTDKSGNGYNGIIYGNPACVEGMRGKAFQFDGFDDYMKVSVPLDGSKDWTICSWVNVGSLDENYTDYQNIISNSEDGFQVGIDHWYDDPAIWDDRWILFGGQNTISINENALLCFTKTYDTLRILKNGIEIANNDLGHLISFTTLSTIGMWDEYATSLFDREPLNGVLDELCIYNRGLSESEIQDLNSGYNCDGTPSFVSASIDINPQTLNLKSMGNWITVYIELTNGYSIEDINKDTVVVSKINSQRLTAPIVHVGPFEIGDNNKNGITDLMMKFDRQNMILLPGHGNVELTISGELLNGKRFEGVAAIRVIDKNNK